MRSSRIGWLALFTFLILAWPLAADECPPDDDEGGQACPSSVGSLAVQASTGTFVSIGTTPITGWTEALDLGAAFDPVAGTFTAPNAGVYVVLASVDLNACPVACFAQITVNGTSVAGAFLEAGWTTLHRLAQLAAGDVVRVNVGNNVDQNLGAVLDEAALSIHRIE